METKKQMARKAEIKKVKEYLRTNLGYQISEENCPRGIDIVGKKDGVSYYFAVSVLNNTGGYFGSTNKSEWKIEKENQGHMFFIIWRSDLDDGKPGKFTQFTPEEIVQYSNSLSFKLTFIVDFDAKGMISTRKNNKYTVEEIRNMVK